MPKTTNTDLELLLFGQQGWNTSIAENAVKLNNILEKVPPLWDLSAQSENSILTWNNSTGKWEIGVTVIELPLALTDGANISIDALNRTMFTVTIAGNRAVANPTNLVDGKKYEFFITQDSVGGRTLTWGNAFYFPEGSCVLSTSPDLTDKIEAICIDGKLYCNVFKGFENLAPIYNVVTAKSVIFDFTDNWGGAGAMMCRSIDFYFEGTKLQVGNGVNFIAYGDAYSSSYAVTNLFDVTKSKTGAHLNNGWQTNLRNNTIRVICVFETPQTFDAFVVNNHHDSGTNTNFGVKNTIAYTSDLEITSLTYGEEPASGYKIFDSQIAQHPSINAEDEQEFNVLLLDAYTISRLIELDTFALPLEEVDSNVLSVSPVVPDSIDLDAFALPAISVSTLVE